MAGVAKTDWIWMDGELVRWEDATVHVLTHTLHYGVGIFEGTRAYQRSDGGTSVFRLDDHRARLANSAHIMQLEIRYSREDIRAGTTASPTQLFAGGGGRAARAPPGRAPRWRSAGPDLWRGRDR